MIKNVTNKYAFGNSSQVESLMLPMPHIVLETIGGGILQNDILQSIGENCLPNQSFNAKKQHDIADRETRCASSNVLCNNAFFVLLKESKSLFTHIFILLGLLLTALYSGSILLEKLFAAFSYS